MEQGVSIRSCTLDPMGKERFADKSIKVDYLERKEQHLSGDMKLVHFTLIILSRN